MQCPMIKANSTPSPTEVEGEECLWTDKGLVIIMIAVEMVDTVMFPRIDSIWSAP